MTLGAVRNACGDTTAFARTLGIDRANDVVSGSAECFWQPANVLARKDRQVAMAGSGSTTQGP